MFWEVITILYHPLTIRENEINYATHTNKIKYIVLHLPQNKNMAMGVVNTLEDAIARI